MLSASKVLFEFIIHPFRLFNYYIQSVSTNCLEVRFSGYLKCLTPYKSLFKIDFIPAKNRYKNILI